MGRTVKCSKCEREKYEKDTQEKFKNSVTCKKFYSSVYGDDYK